MELRRLHPTWGAKKLLKVLQRRRPKWNLRPVRPRVTCSDVPAWCCPAPPSQARAPGSPHERDGSTERGLDRRLQGEFKTRNGYYCYPLTVADGYSRYLLACQGLTTTAVKPSKGRIQASVPGVWPAEDHPDGQRGALCHVSAGSPVDLSAWWIRLGVSPELIEPGRPDQNGRHERMHKTLKAEATRPPSGSLPAQQVRFNRFRREFNEDRPHEAWSRRPLLPATKVAATASSEAVALRLPGAPRGPPRLDQRGHALRCRRVNVTTTPHRAIRRSRGGWRRPLGRILLPTFGSGRLDERRMRIEDEPVAGYGERKPR